MSTNHNRIKVADLEINQPNKILTTNSEGELEFNNISNIKVDNYNGLDYTQEGKVLDARQGKVLKDSLDNLNNSLDIKEDKSNKVQNIEENKNSTSAFPSIKSLYDWSKSIFKTWLTDIENFSSTAYTLNIDNINKTTIFSSSSPITITIPSDSVVSLPIGTKKEFVQKGTGLVTINGSGISFIANIPLTMTSGETRTLTKIENNTWIVNGNKQSSQIVKGVYFVSSTGNNLTAEPENPNKPYLTLDAAITSFFADPNSTYIQILSPSVFYINVAMNNGTTKKFDLRSEFECTVNVMTTNIYTVDRQYFNVEIPMGGINFNPNTSSRNGFNNSFVDIKSSWIEFSSTYQAGSGNSSEANLVCKILNVKITNPDGIFSGTGGSRKINIEANTINFRGATYLVGSFMNLTLEFDNLTHDSSFLLLNSAFTSGDINHGSISSVVPHVNSTNFSYLYGNNVNIKFKGNAQINSNISINRFNCNGSCIITGIAKYTNSDQFIAGGNNFPGLMFINANITAKNLIAGRDLTKSILFSNCTFTLLGGCLISYVETRSSVNYDEITAEFVGSNYIIVQNDNQYITYDEPFWLSTNQPTWNIKNGILFTNGVISAGVNIQRRNLNQYNSTTIIL
ncbi:hypothetical protein ASE40_21215 [Flavobacterium sp. Root935]|uniref:hypothetical protein n=1 Tax=Flavobacterium sp. Root935 TaxID=1736610 RepID=UPI00070914C7|nr:hypothetical protein [Flavobacterium sp. Root935]KRD58825.1 hypothetical protein ASE40_21215 [Flavobacterium sp. Root935]